MFEITIGVVVLIILFIFMSSYVKAPPDTAFIISGIKRGKDGSNNGRVVVGKAAIRIPFLERVDKISLSIMQVNVKTRTDVPTIEYINVYVDGISNVKVASSDPAILRAAQNFLGRSQVEIGAMVQEILEGNIREIVGQMKLSELIQDRAVFSQRVQESAMKDMEKMGIEIINFNIQNLTDQVDAIKNLGIDNVVRLSKDAAISRANAERDIVVAQAKASQEANESKALSEMKIAEQNKEVSLKKSEYQREMDSKQAAADASYKIQEQEQRKTIETASVSADIARREKEVELREREIALTEKMLDAEIKKKADAERYAVQQKAEAEKFKKEQEAIASRFANEEEAKGIEAKGLAEAKAIEAKAEAMRKMGEASIVEMYLQVLPDVVKNAASPLTQTEKIVMYGDGNSTKMVRDVMGVSNQIIDGLKEATGINVKELVDAFVSKRGVAPEIVKVPTETGI